MRPEFASQLRKWKWPFLILWGVAIFAAMWLYAARPVYDFAEDLMKTEVEEVIPPPEMKEVVERAPEILYVQGDDVQFWPLVVDQPDAMNSMRTCDRTKRLTKYDKGLMVSVIQERNDDMIEVVLVGHEHNHGCIHKSMLGPEKPE